MHNTFTTWVKHILQFFNATKSNILQSGKREVKVLCKANFLSQLLGLNTVKEPSSRPCPAHGALGKLHLLENTPTQSAHYGLLFEAYGCIYVYIYIYNYIYIYIRIHMKKAWSKSHGWQKAPRTVPRSDPSWISLMAHGRGSMMVRSISCTSRCERKCWGTSLN